MNWERIGKGAVQLQRGMYRTVSQVKAGVPVATFEDSAGNVWRIDSTTFYVASFLDLKSLNVDLNHSTGGFCADQHELVCWKDFPNSLPGADGVWIPMQGTVYVYNLDSATGLAGGLIATIPCPLLNGLLLSNTAGYRFIFRGTI